MSFGRVTYHQFRFRYSRDLSSLPPNPIGGRYVRGSLLATAGVITMVLGGITVASGLAEVGESTAAVPATFGISDILAVIHAPVVIALGVIIFSVGHSLLMKGRRWRGILAFLCGPTARFSILQINKLNYTECSMLQSISYFFYEWFKRPSWVASVGMLAGFLLFLVGVIWKVPHERILGSVTIGLCLLIAIILYYSG